METRCLQIFACVHAPDFPVQAAWWCERVLTASRQVPVAIVDGPDSLLKVIASNNLARKAGVVFGMTKIQAEACPGIEVRRRVMDHEEVTQHRLLDIAYKFSSHVESMASGTVILDMSGAERLLGTPQEIGTKILDDYGTSFSVNVGVATNLDTALHAARGFSGLTVIAPGQEAACLACLPISVLPIEPEVLDTLHIWGVRDFKTLATLPVIPLSQRLGQNGLYLQSLARGQVHRELVPAEPPPAFVETVELEEAVDLLEPLGFVLHRSLQQLCQRLTARCLATDEIGVVLDLEVHADREVQTDPAKSGEGKASHQTKLKLPVPTQDAAVLLKLLQLDLIAHPPSAAVKKITLKAVPTRVRTTQTGLFQPLAPEPAKLEITLARLRAVVGKQDEQGRERVGFPQVMDSNRPESFSVQASFSPSPARELPERRTSTVLGMRIFRPPLPARVELSAGAPGLIVFGNERAKVKQASGPWQSGGQWWSRATEWKREEWDVSLARNNGAAVYRIFKDCSSGRWFVEGMYD